MTTFLNGKDYNLTQTILTYLFWESINSEGLLYFAIDKAPENERLCL